MNNGLQIKTPEAKHIATIGNRRSIQKAKLMTVAVDYPPPTSHNHIIFPLEIKKSIGIEELRLWELPLMAGCVGARGLRR